MNLDLNAVKSQEFFGKLDFFSYLEDETLEYISESVEDISASIVSA